MSLSDLSLASIILPNGIELNYVRKGAGMPLVFIHGAMGDWRSWTPQWDAFTQNFDCISYSRRYSYPNNNELIRFDHNALVDAQDLKCLMDALNIKQAILVGSSYGGFTALAFALAFPSQVSALVAVEPPMMRYAYRSEEGAKIAESFRMKFIEPARAEFQNGNDADGVSILTGGITGKPSSDVPAHILKGRMENMRAAKSLSMSSDEFPMLAPDELANLPMPILLMSGKNTAPIHDAIFQNVIKVMSSAKALKVEGSGHSVSAQQPDTFNAVTMSFLEAANT